ncbi:hypothetical protein GCM10010129_57020 [Streptomyces fumigatiscleroticus]|nr:hypothetical protein GCM10010129_57020 [Streptomyces fumigatiscleroticus]
MTTAGQDTLEVKACRPVGPSGGTAPSSIWVIRAARGRYGLQPGPRLPPTVQQRIQAVLAPVGPPHPVRDEVLARHGEDGLCSQAQSPKPRGLAASCRAHRARNCCALPIALAPGVDHV